MVRAFETLHPADGFTFRIDSPIPPAGGLGSSAAAAVAGLMAADHIFELDADLLAAATELEGHPDNAAAVLLGGFVVCAGRRGHALRRPRGPRGRRRRAPRVRPHARRRGPRCPPRSRWTTRCSTSAHASLLVLGLAKGEWDLVARGLHDRVHQPRRAHLYPESLSLVERAQELGALGATISGAGPAVLFWTHYEQTGGVVEALRRAAPDAEIRRVPFEPQGAEVREL